MTNQKHPTTDIAAFTPGPWKTDPNIGHQQVLGPDGIAVADCSIIFLHKDSPTPERNRANARLVATTPDLLACLEASTDALIIERSVLDDSITNGDGTIREPADGEELAELNRLIDANQTAIAKATGGSQ